MSPAGHWRELDDDERQREYSPSSVVGEIGPLLAEYRTRSDEVASGGEELRYGPAAEQVTVLFRVDDPSAPLHVFFHGGYWQELGVADSLFPAAGFAARGIAFAAVGYELAPAATIDEIVAACREALAHVLRTSGLTPARITVSGSSAGAHLAAMVALAPWPGERTPIDAAVLVSGIFELEPLIGTSINDALGLDREAARRASPLLLDPPGRPATLVCVGENETAEFKAQSTDYAAFLRSHHVPVAELVIAGRNHFDVILDLSTAGTGLGDRSLRLTANG